MIAFLYGVLIVCCAMCLFRISRGPTSADRIMATDILGIVVVGFCALLALVSGQDYYLTIAIAWALLSYIGTIALAKFLEGKGFDE